MDKARLSQVAGFDVSRETLDRLALYHDLLLQWTRKINLISKNTTIDAWDRHFIDSAQVFQLAPNSGNWVDLGSGAGFQGLVIAILAAQDHPDLRFTLIESDARKCAFLRNVSRETGVSVDVRTARIEQITDIRADIVSARALASLDDLFGFSHKMLNPQGIGLFLKGKTCSKELSEARQNWSFTATETPSATDLEGTVLAIKELSRGGA